MSSPGPREESPDGRLQVLNVRGDSSDIQQGQVVTNTMLVPAVEYDSSRNVGLAGLLNATRQSSGGVDDRAAQDVPMATMSSAAWSLDAGEMFGRVIRSWR